MDRQDLGQRLPPRRHHRVTPGLDLHALTDAGGGGVHQLAVHFHHADAGIVHIDDALQVIKGGDRLL